jgi:hypothetical protein
MTSSFIYYVYAYIRSKDTATAKAGTPYYIGKGKGNRAYRKHSVPVPNNRNYIIFLETNLSEVGALALERFYLRWWGCKHSGGILRNIIDGYGSGATNVGQHISETKSSKEWREGPGKIAGEKISKAKLGVKFTEEHRRKISEYQKNRIVSDVTKEKMSKSRSGIKQSNSHKENIRKANIGLKLISKKDNPLERKKVPANELQTFLSNGWVLGAQGTSHLSLRKS